MSAKRAKTANDTLTGGTHDVNPQYLNGTITMSAANTETQVTLGTPIVRVGPQSGGEAIIMEVLKVYADMPLVDATGAGATARIMNLTFATTSVLGTSVTFGNSKVFAFLQKSVFNSFTAAGTGMQDIQVDPQVYDCTDGAGHGILIATDNIFIVANTTNQTGAGIFNFKILYRFKRVSLVEYIGIVQSQQ